MALPYNKNKVFIILQLYMHDKGSMNSTLRRQSFITNSNYGQRVHCSYLKVLKRILVAVEVNSLVSGKSTEPIRIPKYWFHAL